MPQTIIISSPADGATVASSALIVDNDSTSQCGGRAWYDACYFNGAHYADKGFSQCPITTSGTYAVHAHTSSNLPNPAECAQSNSITVTVASPTPTLAPTVTPTSSPTATPTPGSLPLAPLTATDPIPALTGSVAQMQTALPYINADPATFGVYNETGGVVVEPDGRHIAICCGPLLDDRQAASVVLVAPQVNQEKNGAQAQYLNYFQTQAASNPQGYIKEIQAVQSFPPSGWAVVLDRVDGAIPIANPTEGETIQWAANKWGFNPLYGYTEACDEGDYNNGSLGDGGTSSGVFQVADRGANHGWSPLVQSNSNLPRESLAYNADFFFATRWASFHPSTNPLFTGGLTGETPSFNIADAIESWFSGHAGTCPDGQSDCDYQAMIYSDMESGYRNGGISNNSTNPPCFETAKYYGQVFNYAAPMGTLPHE